MLDIVEVGLQYLIIQVLPRFLLPLTHIMAQPESVNAFLVTKLRPRFHTGIEAAARVAAVSVGHSRQRAAENTVSAAGSLFYGIGRRQLFILHQTANVITINHISPNMQCGCCIRV